MSTFYSPLMEVFGLDFGPPDTDEPVYDMFVSVNRGRTMWFCNLNDAQMETLCEQHSKWGYVVFDIRGQALYDITEGKMGKVQVFVREHINTTEEV